MSIQLDDATYSVKSFSVSLSQSVNPAHHKEFRVVESDFSGVIDTAVLYSWSPIVWNNNTRQKSNFKSCAIVALDIDDGFPLEDAKVWLQSMKYESAILLSKSHQKEKSNQPPCDRFRIIINAELIDSLTSYEANMKRWLGRLPMADHSCKDGGRYFFPSPVLAYTQSGKVFQWEDCSRDIEEEKERVRQANKIQRERFKASGAISEGLRNFIIKGVPLGHRHKACFWLGCVLAELGIGFEESVRIVSSGALIDIGLDDIRRQILWGRKKVMNGESNKGGDLQTYRA